MASAGSGVARGSNVDSTWPSAGEGAERGGAFGGGDSTLCTEERAAWSIALLNSEKMLKSAGASREGGGCSVLEVRDERSRRCAGNCSKCAYAASANGARPSFEATHGTWRSCRHIESCSCVLNKSRAQRAQTARLERESVLRRAPEPLHAARMMRSEHTLTSDESTP